MTTVKIPTTQVVGTGTQRFREGKPSTQSHTAVNGRVRLTPQPLRVPQTGHPAGVTRTSFLGEWEWLHGLSKRCTPIPTGLAKGFPVWSSLGGPQRLSGGAPGYLQPLEVPDGHCTFTESRATTTYIYSFALGRILPTHCAYSDSLGWWELSRHHSCPRLTPNEKDYIIQQIQFACWANKGLGANNSRRDFSGGNVERNSFRNLSY